MFPDNIKTAFLIGNEMEYNLFQLAVSFAENGLDVWYVTTERIEAIPGKIKRPSTEILKLITFLYLKNYQDLVKHLNNIHNWYKKPTVLIVTEFEKYVNLSNGYDELIAGYFISLLLDSISTCASKKQKTGNLVIGCNEMEEHSGKLKVLNDMYFPFMIRKENCIDMLNVLINHFDL